MAVAKPSCRRASRASAAKGSRASCSMARRSWAWGMARISASRWGAWTRTWPKISAPDQRSSRGGRARPRSRMKASISRPTALRSRGELTRVWSRSKTQTGGAGVTVSAAMCRLGLGVQEKVPEQLDAAAVEGAVGHDELDVLGKGGADDGCGLLRAHDGSRALQHAIERPGIVGGGEHSRDVHEPGRLHGAEKILPPRGRGAHRAPRGALGQLGESKQCLDACLGEERHCGRRVRGQMPLHLVDVKEGCDDAPIRLEKAGVAGHLRLELVHEHAVYLERQLCFELVAIARELRVVALHEHRALPEGLAHPPGGPARGEGSEEFVLGEAEPPRAGQALAHQTLQAVGGAPFTRGPVGDKGAGSLLPLDIAVGRE